MSRGYDGYDGCDDSNIGYVWHSVVARAARGERGQKLLSDLCAALDAMPDKKLITGRLFQPPGDTTAQTYEGGFCTLGVLGAARGLDMEGIDPHAYNDIAQTFGCAYSLAREIMAENDEGGPPNETPAARWERMRAWVAARIILESSSTQDQA